MHIQTLCEQGLGAKGILHINRSWNTLQKLLKLLTKSSVKFDSFFVNIHGSTACSLEKSKLWSLNYCIYLTMQAVLMKSAGYFVWIFVYKIREFGSISYYRCWYLFIYLLYGLYTR